MIDQSNRAGKELKVKITSLSNNFLDADLGGGIPSGAGYSPDYGMMGGQQFTPPGNYYYHDKTMHFVSFLLSGA